MYTTERQTDRQTDRQTEGILLNAYLYTAGHSNAELLPKAKCTLERLSTEQQSRTWANEKIWLQNEMPELLQQPEMTVT